jgi:hypothetical protein
MERKIKLVPYRVYKHCPKCPGIMEVCNYITISSGTGALSGITTGSSTYTMSTQHWNHRCNKCGHGENYDKTYPYIDYKEDGDVE